MKKIMYKGNNISNNMMLKYKILTLLSEYMSEVIDLPVLLTELTGIENQIKEESNTGDTDEGLWFKFGDNPLAITLYDIKRDLGENSTTYTANQDFYYELMENAINTAKIKIHFS